jgi:CRP-like cAMP-binding protein
MSHLTAAQRLAQVVHRMAKEAGRRGVGGMMIDITNEELANQGGITIFTVSRLLSDWRRRGLLTKSRGRIIVRSPEDLLRQVERDIA